MTRTLEQLLTGQDLNAKATAEKVLNDRPLDGITQIIVSAWKDSGGETGELDLEEYVSTLDYARNQIQKAINAATIKGMLD